MALPEDYGVAPSVVFMILRFEDMLRSEAAHKASLVLISMRSLFTKWLEEFDHVIQKQHRWVLLLLDNCSGHCVALS